jgi:hypothetical protein
MGDDDHAGQRLSGSEATFSYANVPGQVSPLAFGMTPAREAEKAGGMTKVPQAWGLTAPARSHIFFRGPMACGMSLAFLSASGGPWESWG